MPLDSFRCLPHLHPPDPGYFADNRGRSGFNGAAEPTFAAQPGSRLWLAGQLSARQRTRCALAAHVVLDQQDEATPDVRIGGSACAATRKMAAPPPRGRRADSAVLPFGTFRFDTRTRRVVWSDSMYSIYGFEVGDVVPSLELITSHQLPGGPPAVGGPVRAAACRRRPVLLALRDPGRPAEAAGTHRNRVLHRRRCRCGHRGTWLSGRPDRDPADLPRRRDHQGRAAVCRDPHHDRSGQGRDDGQLRSGRATGVRSAAACIRHTQISSSGTSPARW